MDLGFVNWWFETHPFWSTLLTPAMTLAWCFYKGLLWRGIAAGFLTLVVFGRAGSCWCRKPEGGGAGRCGGEKAEEKA